MTLPMSALATLSSSIDVCIPPISVTDTTSGSSTIARAIISIISSMAQHLLWFDIKWATGLVSAAVITAKDWLSNSPLISLQLRRQPSGF
jgi:hypothetical protein